MAITTTTTALFVMVVGFTGSDKAWYPYKVEPTAPIFFTKKECELNKGPAKYETIADSKGKTQIKLTAKCLKIDNKEWMQ